MTLIDMDEGGEATISALPSQINLQRQLVNLGLIPGAKIRVVKILRWNGAVQINANHANLILRAEMAKQIVMEG